jgi:hypothetical protein
VIKFVIPKSGIGTHENERKHQFFLGREKNRDEAYRVFSIQGGLFTYIIWLFLLLLFVRSK